MFKRIFSCNRAINEGENASLGIDYRFYPRTDIGKNIYTKNYVCFEAFEIRQLERIIEAFRLPDFPFYYCAEMLLYKPLNYDFEYMLDDLPNSESLAVIREATCRWTNKEKERYQAYLDWINFGLGTMDKITSEDIIKNKKIPKRFKAIYVEDLESLKTTIRKLLKLYKNHWYMFTAI